MAKFLVEVETNTQDGLGALFMEDMKIYMMIQPSVMAPPQRFFVGTVVEEEGGPVVIEDCSPVHADINALREDLKSMVSSFQDLKTRHWELVKDLGLDRPEAEQRGTLSALHRRIAVLEEQEVFERIDYEKLSDRIDYETLGANIDLADLADEVAGRVEMEEIASRIDVSDVASEINLNALAGEIDMDELADKFSVSVSRN